MDDVHRNIIATPDIILESILFESQPENQMFLSVIIGQQEE